MTKRGGRRKLPRNPTPFTRLLEDAILRVFGTQRDLADKLGLSQAHISRVLNGHEQLSIEQSLHLALWLGLDPEVVWEASGQHEFVEKHRKVYGPAQPTQVVIETRPEDRRLLDAISALHDDDRRFLTNILTRGTHDAAVQQQRHLVDVPRPQGREGAPRQHQDSRARRHARPPKTK